MKKSKIQVTIVPRQVGELFDQFLQNILDDLTKQSHDYQSKPLKQLIPNHYYPSYNLNQGKCYQQHSGNLCGYHATFNSLCCLNMFLNIPSQYNILNGASFWKFKSKVEKFLLQIKKTNKLSDNWPWREKDIKTGDFQRTYNKICLEMFDDFDIFKDHQSFNYLSMTWEFQYQNLILSEDGRKDFNKKVNYFRSYKDKKPLIFGVMLAITGHWTLFMAFKQADKTEYWYFDSKNRLSLDMNQTEINSLIQDLNKSDIEKGQQQWTPFQKQNYSMCVRDTQTSIRLIISCLEGKANIQEYSYNQTFNIFAKPIERITQLKNIQEIQRVLKQYWYNIGSFFSKPVSWNLLNQESKNRMKFLFQTTKLIKNDTYYGNNLYNFINKSCGKF